MNPENIFIKAFFLVVFFVEAAAWMVLGHLVYYAFNPFIVGGYYRELVLGISPVTAALIIYWISTALCSLVIIFFYDYRADKKTEVTFTLSVINLIIYVFGLILWGIYYGFTHYPL